MTLLDINEIFEGKYSADLNPKDRPKTITLDNLNSFRELIAINDVYSQGLLSTDSSKEFYETYELLGKTVDPELQEDLFYASKLGFFYQDVPCKIVYLLKSAIRKYNTPNNAISALDLRNVSRYLKRGYLPDGITFKRIMENLMGREFDLISSYKRKVKFKDAYEIYVENVDRVLIVPEDIAQLIDSQADLKGVSYVKNVGVCVHDIPIRTLAGRVGITLNEYDLRECK